MKKEILSFAVFAIQHFVAAMIFNLTVSAVDLDFEPF